uniref:Uncharacterized protein n=1 Tax=Apteryx owenii TaxID=8824 RepID=A0A8B9NU03_APTOW
MTWSLPEGSLISGFHSEECFYSSPIKTGTPPLLSYTALRGTWLGSPARWCSSGTTPGHGYVLRCAHPGSGRKGRESQKLSCDSVVQTKGSKGMGMNASPSPTNPSVLSTSEVITSGQVPNHGHGVAFATATRRFLVAEG